MISRKKQPSLKKSTITEQRLPVIPQSSSYVPPSTPSSSNNGHGQGLKEREVSKRKLAGIKLEPGTSVTGPSAEAVTKVEKEIVKVNGNISSSRPPCRDVKKQAPVPSPLDALIANLSHTITTENEGQKQREIKRLILSLSDLGNVDDHRLTKLIKELRNNVEVIDEKFYPVVQQILTGNWYNRSSKIVSLVESLVSELVIVRPGFAVAAMHSFIAKFSPNLTCTHTRDVDDFSEEETKCFNICHENLERLFVSFPMKQENGVKAIGKLYPYMGKSSHTHYCYVYNILQAATSYLTDVSGQLLHIIIHKLARIDVNIPKQDIEAVSDNQVRIKAENGGNEMFMLDLEETMKLNPMIETLDLCLNMIFEYVDHFFRPVPTEEEDGEGEVQVKDKKSNQVALFNTFLQIFQTEILPTFGTNSVQFLYFYLLSLQPAFLTTFLEFLWKNATNLNTSPVIRVQIMSYLSGILARAEFISIKTVKRWLTKMSDWANNYAGQKSKACHWSSVNVQAHGPFYAVCQTIFYVFAFRNKELISSRKSHSYTRSLDLGRLVTSDLNPLKACEEQIASFFVKAAHQHQISYCSTVLERNQGARIPTIAREMLSNLSAEAEFFECNQLEPFFPFDPLLLPRSKKWMEGIYKTYEEYSEEVKVEELKTRGEAEDSIEMELGSYPSSKEFYCNGVSPFQFKVEEGRGELEGFID